MYPSQSSSRPLHVSAGGSQPEGAGGTQSSVHVPEPSDRHVVMHATTLPLTHSNGSSATPSQSSSRPLQVSSPVGRQALSHPGTPSLSSHPGMQAVPHAPFWHVASVWL